jgi:hypothetical protein
LAPSVPSALAALPRDDLGDIGITHVCRQLCSWQSARRSADGV